MDETRLSAKSCGYVETVFGRRLYLPEINSPNGPRRSGAERAAINSPIQGTAADMIKLAIENHLEAADSLSFDEFLAEYYSNREIESPVTS